MQGTAAPGPSDRKWPFLPVGFILKGGEPGERARGRAAAGDCVRTRGKADGGGGAREECEGAQRGCPPDRRCSPQQRGKLRAQSRGGGLQAAREAAQLKPG